MLALSLREPWCSAILLCGKNVENRRWVPPRHMLQKPTRFLLHAAKAMTRNEYGEAIAWMTGSGIETRPLVRENLQFGGIVGAATLVGYIPKNCPRPQAERLAEELGVDLRWWMPDQNGLCLRDIAACTLIPCTGALGFFQVPEDVTTAIARLYGRAPEEPANV